MKALVRTIAQSLNLLTSNAFIITITGTNGKGSCAELLTHVYHKAGYNVGTYTSPHLYKPNERIRINTKPISDDVLQEATDTINTMASDLIYFDLMTLSAFWIFSKHALDIIILEVGIGGRLDATNAWDADAAIITCVDFDHQALLGATREAIGFEKAHIFRTNKPVIYGDPNPPQSVLNMAEKLQCPLFILNQNFGYNTDHSLCCSPTLSHSSAPLRHSRSPLRHSRAGGNPENTIFFYSNTQKISLPSPKLLMRNVAISLQTLITLQDSLPIDINAALPILANTTLPGRAEKKVLSNGNILYLDVAHNQQAVTQLYATLQQHLEANKPRPKVAAFFSCFDDKDISSMIKIIAPFVDIWHIAEIPEPRGASLKTLLAAFNALSLKPIIHPSLEQASDTLMHWLHTEPNRLGVAFGSFRVVEISQSKLKLIL